MVVLHERIGNSQVGEFLLVVGLQKKAPRVAKDFRLEFQDSRKSMSVQDRPA